MHKARQDRDYTAKELVAQRKSKQNARKNPFVLECERVKKQEYRKKKRKIDEMHECIVIEETSKKHKNKLDDHRDIKECIKQFHSSIAVGPLFVCTRDDQKLHGLSSYLNNGLDKHIQISSNDTWT